MPKSKLEEDPFPKVPPFVIKTQAQTRGVDVRGLLRISTMFVSLGALTLAMGGAGKMVWDVFQDGFDTQGLFAKVTVLGLAYFFGWGVALVSIRYYGSMVYQIIINIYAVVCLIAISGLYLKVIQKLFLQGYETWKFWVYLIMLLGGLLVLIGLHLLVEKHDLRPFAIPLLILSVLQLFAIVFRYIFTANPDVGKLWGDLLLFMVMISISALMLAHLGILAPMRDGIDSLFKPGTKKPMNDEEDDTKHHWVR